MAALWLACAPGRVSFDEIARFAPSLEHLADAVGGLLPSEERALYDRRVAKLGR